MVSVVADSFRSQSGCGVCDTLIILDILVQADATEYYKVVVAMEVI